MLKKILFTAFLFAPISLFAQNVFSNQQETTNKRPSFGYFSYSEVFQAMPEYADAQEALNILKEKYDKELQRSEEDFNKKYAEFLQDQKDFPETILMRRQKELQQLMEQSIDFKNEVKRLLDDAQQEVTAPVVEKLNAALNTIGTKYGFYYILNTDNNAYPYISADSGMDITQEVKDQLGIKDTVVE